MSTIAYAQLTNKREEAAPNTSTTTSSPGIKTYIDAFAALVPTEVLTLHALIVAASTTTTTAASMKATHATAAASASIPASSAAVSVSSTSSPTGSVTTILPGAESALQTSFWILLALSLVLYVIPRYYGGKWDRYDLVRALIAPLAFVGWTMLQRATAFDAAFPAFGSIDRTVYALILGAVLGAVTAGLAAKADAKPAL